MEFLNPKWSCEDDRGNMWSVKKTAPILNVWILILSLPLKYLRDLGCATIYLFPNL